MSHFSLKKVLKERLIPELASLFYLCSNVPNKINTLFFSGSIVRPKIK